MSVKKNFFQCTMDENFEIGILDGQITLLNICFSVIQCPPSETKDGTVNRVSVYLLVELISG